MAEAYTPWKECRELGQGTFGEVRSAVRKADGLAVALKRIKRDADHAKFGVSFSALREIRVMRELKHPHLVDLLDVFVDPTSQQLVLVLELLGSTDLEGVIRHAREGQIKLGPADAKSYASMLLKGLAFLHQHWILHRDLKPGNVFLTANGVVKLGDFGFARTATPSPARLLSPNACTQWYRAPELLFGAVEYGPASDCWSCGCVIAELWLLRPLFRGKLDGENNGNNNEGSSSSSDSSDSSELDQLGKIFMHCGTPSEANWPGVSELHRFVEFQPCAPAPRLLPLGTSAGDDPEAARLVKGLLTLDPQKRLSAADCLALPYFSNAPPPTLPAALPR